MVDRSSLILSIRRSCTPSMALFPAFHEPFAASTTVWGTKLPASSASKPAVQQASSISPFTFGLWFMDVLSLFEPSNVRNLSLLCVGADGSHKARILMELNIPCGPHLITILQYFINNLPMGNSFWLFSWLHKVV